MLQRNRSRSKHVVHVVPAEQRTVHRLAHFAADKIETGAFGSKHLDVLRPYVRRNAGCGLHPKHHHLALEIAAELADIFIVGVQDCRATVRKGRNQLVFRARDAGNGVEALQMHGSHVGDHGFVRQSDAGQGGNFSRVRHPHLDDSDIVFRFERK